MMIMQALRMTRVLSIATLLLTLSACTDVNDDVRDLGVSSSLQVADESASEASDVDPEHEKTKSWVLQGESPSILVRAAPPNPDDARLGSAVAGEIVVKDGCIGLRSETGSVATVLFPFGSTLRGDVISLPSGDKLVPGDDIRMDGMWSPTTKVRGTIEGNTCQSETLAILFPVTP